MNAVIARAQHRRSLWAAALATCFVAPLVIAVGLPLVLVLVNPGNADTFTDALFTAPLLFVVAVPFTILGIYTCEVPAAFWLVRRGKLAFVHLAIAGPIGGLVSGTVFGWFAGPAKLVYMYSIGVPIGVIAGIVFALLAGVPVRRGS